MKLVEKSSKGKKKEKYKGREGRRIQFTRCFALDVAPKLDTSGGVRATDLAKVPVIGFPDSQRQMAYMCVRSTWQTFLIYEWREKLCLSI